MTTNLMLSKEAAIDAFIAEQTKLNTAFSESIAKNSQTMESIQQNLKLPSESVSDIVTKNSQDIILLQQNLEFPITRVTDTPNPYWLVDISDIILIETYWNTGRTKSDISITKSNGVKASREFVQGDLISIIMPVGNWNVESSIDGTNYNFSIMLTSIDHPPKGPSSTVNINIDGQVTMPESWYRYTKM